MTNESSVNKEELDKFKKLAHEWWARDGELKTLHDINPARMEFIRSFVDLSQKRVLDLGSGGGILSEALCQKGAIVTGVDAEETAISVAKAHAKVSGLQIDYICSAIEDYEAPKFDIIVCMEMLEHVSSPKLIIRNCKRLLKDGGFLFLSTINRNLHAYLSAVVGAEYVLKIIPKNTHEYDKFIKPSELVNLIREYNFETIAIKGLDYNPFTRKAELTSKVKVNYLLAATF